MPRPFARTRASGPAIALATLSATGCFTTRTPGPYQDRIPMTSEEADLVDTLDASVSKISGFHERCNFWLAARARVRPDQGGAIKYVAAQTKGDCQNDPAFELRGTLADRDEMIVRETAGYTAEGANVTLVAGQTVAIRTVRGRCYMVAVRFSDGFTPKEHVFVEHTRFVSTAGTKVSFGSVKNGPGPGAVLSLGCAYEDTEGTLSLKTDAGTSAQATLFVKALSEEETARREADDRAQWKAAEADNAVSKRSRMAEHCVRCQQDLADCLSGGSYGHASCPDAYVSCLAEDRGDYPMTPADCGP